MNIALLGPSGAGKGTQAPQLCSGFNLQQISTGDLLRENLQKRTAIGLLVRQYMDRAELVPDELVDAMIEERLQAVPPATGILFDGFPRTPEQAAFLDELLKRSGRRLDAAIYLKVSAEEVLNRLGGRLICRDCHAPYHAPSNLPARANLCDACGGELQPRPDDHAEMARTRLRVFQRHIGPVLKYYQPSHLLHLVDGGGTAEAVRDALVSLLEAVQRGEASGATSVEVASLQPAARAVTADAALPASTVLNVVLLGGPGSGKGTQAESLEREFKLCHVASGDLFRENLKNATRLGELAKGYMNRGELVPDDITEAMVEERLARPDTEGGFLLDGFPRTVPQAEALAEMLARLVRPLAGVLYIHVSDDSLVERLSGRWICRSCQTPYHLSFRPPARAGLCDKCGGELFQRDDDKPETVRARLKTFHKQTEPLIEHYRRAGLLTEVDGEGGVSRVSRLAQASVQTLLRELRLPSFRLNHSPAVLLAA